MAEALDRRSVLLISYLFPPAGGVAVQRALSFARYLPESGCRVHVLSARNASAPVHDPGLLSRIPAHVGIHRTFTPELPFGFRQRLWKLIARGKGKPAAPGQPQQRPGKSGLAAELVRRILCPEPEVLWFPFAYPAARRLIRRFSIGTVIVTAPPFSTFLVGNALKRWCPELTLVSDFRDDWLRYYVNMFDFQRSDYTRRKAEQIQAATVALSDLVVGVTESITGDLRSRYPEQPDAKFVHIPNGYDPELFASFTPRRREDSPRRIVVTHLGTTYAGSSPAPFLAALANVPESIRSAVEVQFVGRVNPSERGCIEACANARVEGFMPQAEALRRMETTDFLLVITTDANSIRGKLYEYLATGKPVLAVAPRGSELDNLIRATRAGWCADPRDMESIQAMITQAVEGLQSGRSTLQPDWEMIRSFERTRLAARLASILDGAPTRPAATPIPAGVGHHPQE